MNTLTSQPASNGQTIETHDLFLRAIAMPVETKKRKDRKKLKSNDIQSTDDPSWPEVLAIDTETRTSVDQSLTFGVWKRARLVAGTYEIIEEGIFYADDLPARELKVLDAYMEATVSDVRSFPHRFPLYSRTGFMKKVFWPALKKKGAMVVGFNLGYDLTRIALDWKQGNKGEWSLVLMKYADGKENCNYPRILITPIDSKKQIIKLWLPWEKNQHEWKNLGTTIHFLDVRTMLWALYNKSHSLRSACDNKTGPFKSLNLPQKDDHQPTGEVTLDEIEHCRQDVRCTVALLNACKQEFDKHPDIDLKPWNAYSPASFGKATLKAMGIIRPEIKFEISNEQLGPWIQGYYGGRSECRIRDEVVPVVPVDFTSEYPSCCANLGLFRILTAARLDFVDDTENIKYFLGNITLEKCFKREVWRDLNFVARVIPDGDVLPVRTVYGGVSQNIGNNYLHANPNHPQAVYMAGPDLVAAVLQQPNRIPRIEQAFRAVPSGVQAGMRSIRLRGKVLIDPNDVSVDLFTKIIEERKRNKHDPDLYYWLKILANSIYGFFVELIPERFQTLKGVAVFSGDESFSDFSRVIETRGKWFAPYLATLITSAGRLLLAMLEVEVSRAGGTYLYCDTDSLAIVATRNGGPLTIPGADAKRALSFDEVDRLTTKFQELNPYDKNDVKDLLNLTDDNYVCGCSHEIKSEHNEAGACEGEGCKCRAVKKVRRQLWGVAIAAKRYTLFKKVQDQLGNTIDIKIVNPKAHGIGFLYPPKDNPENWKKDAPLWIYEMWDYIVRGFLGLERKLPSWTSLPQMMRFSVSTWNVYKMLGMWDGVRPQNFMFMVMTSANFSFDVDFENKPDNKPMVIVPHSNKQQEWRNLEGIDIRNKDRRGKYRHYKLDHPDFHPFTYAHMIQDYVRHPEAKSLGPDGKPCTEDTRGLLQRSHITAGQIRYIDKETSSMWSQSDDLSVISDDEVGFRIVEYGKNRKVVLSESAKKDIRNIGQRELRRRGIGQHTIERALNDRVRLSSHRKILAAIATHTEEGDKHVTNS